MPIAPTRGDQLGDAVGFERHRQAHLAARDAHLDQLPGELATELEEVEPAHPGKLDVEENRVRAFGLELAESGLGGVDDDGLVAELEKIIAEDVAESTWSSTTRTRIESGLAR